MKEIVPPGPARCVLCGWCLPTGCGNNPDPLADGNDGSCCDRCNREKVIPARIKGVGTEAAY